jgi:outer membrane protein assembly factor BamB
VKFTAGPRALVGAASLLALTGCHAIPLNGDPTTPVHGSEVSPPAVYDVEWWNPLVKLGLLEYEPMEQAQPAVDPDTERVIVTTRDGFVRALSPLDGHIEWQFATHGRFYSGPTVKDGVVYVGGGDGVLYALRSVTGELIWQYDAKEELVTAPVVSEGRVLVGSQSETLFAVDAKTGAWVWQYRREAPSGFTIRGFSVPTVVDGLVVAGFADGWLVAVGFDDGVMRWEKKLTHSPGHQFLDVDTSPVADDQGHVFAASYLDGVFALDAKTGDLLWSTPHPGTTSLLLRGGTLYATGDGSLAALGTQKGQALWTLDLSDRTSKGKGNNAGRAPMLARGYIVVPTSTALAFVDPSTGHVRTAFDPGRGVTATPVRSVSARYGSRLYVMSNLGTVFALQMVGSGG